MTINSITTNRGDYLHFREGIFWWPTNNRKISGSDLRKQISISRSRYSLMATQEKGSRF